MADLHLSIDRTAGRLAGQVAAELRHAVRSGRLAEGMRLPASRDLARDLGVSRGVVVEAYEQLTAEGFLVSRQGSGTRVASVAAGDRELSDVAPSSRDLTPGIPDVSAFPRRAWLGSLRHVLHSLPTAELGYGDPAGVAVLRTELAAYVRRVRAASAEPSDVVVTGGVAQAISLVVRSLVASGRQVLALEDPTGTRQRELLGAAGAAVVGVPVDDEGIDVAALCRTPARVVLVTPAHQYPTGVVLSAARRKALIEWAHRVDGYVIEDDYDAEFRFDREPIGCLQGLAPDRVVLTGSVSKSLAPALRLGWAVAPAWLAGRLRASRAASDLGSPVIDQYALAHFIASGGYDRHLRAMRRRYRVRRDALVAALDDWLPSARVHGVSAGLHLYIELAGISEAALAESAAAAGLAVEGVSAMRFSPGPSALVLGYARQPEHRLAEAVRALAKAIHLE